MRVGKIRGIVSLGLSIFCFLPAAMAQGELKTPNCDDPQDPHERMCCGSPSPQVCEIFGYKAPNLETPAASIPPLNEIEILAPWDMTIGMQLSDLDGKLKARGLRRSQDCHWSTYQSQDVSATISVRLLSEEGTESQSCAKDLPIYTIGFQQNESRKEVFSKLPLPAEMAAAWIKRFGEPVNDCRTPYPSAGGPTVSCKFDNISADVKRLSLTYAHQDSAINKSARFQVGITGFERNEKAESASEDSRSAEAVLESELRKPMGKSLHCVNLRNIMKVGGDYIIEGVTIIDKGQMLADMPEACKN